MTSAEEAALADIRGYSAASSGRWRVHGLDADGDGLDVIVVVQDGVLVITVFG